MLKTGEMLKMLKMLKVVWVLAPQWEAFFQKKSKRGGVKTQKTFNIFNISPVLSTFFVGKPFNFLTFLTFPLF